MILTANSFKLSSNRKLLDNKARKGGLIENYWIFLVEYLYLSGRPHPILVSRIQSKRKNEKPLPITLVLFRLI